MGLYEVLVSEMGEDHVIDVPLKDRNVELWIVDGEDRITLRILDGKGVREFIVWERGGGG